MLALSKADLLSEEDVERAVAEWRERLGPEVPVIATSSATGRGLEQLTAELLRRPEFAGVVREGGSYRAPGVAAPAPAPADPGVGPRAIGADGDDGTEDLAEYMVFRPAGSAGFHVERLGPGSFAVRGRGIERLVARYDAENDDAMAYLEGRLRRIGVLKALEAEGFSAGDEIEIAGTIFELDPSAAD